MLQELTFGNSVLLITVVDTAAVRGKFSCKNTPKFTARARRVPVPDIKVYWYLFFVLASV